MPKLYKCSGLPQRLGELIDAYNKKDLTDLEKLFYLQNINYFIKGSTNPGIISWRNKDLHRPSDQPALPGSEESETGLETHLQHYGIHRDASDLLQSIEFAHAVRHFAQEDITVDETPFFKAMNNRDQLFQNKDLITPERMETFTKSNLAIYYHYSKDHALQEKVERNKHLFALTYAKAETIKGAVKQNFEEYDTKVLGNPDGNNKNFILAISDNEKMVIRVEDRNTLGKEKQLQAHAVSEYFSEDYATLMVPFEVDDETEYRPVIISQLASGGDLESYAKKISNQNTEKNVGEVKELFNQLSDFCIKLMDSGHYHPDIKLSNFLIDDGKIVVSDRKTLIDNSKPNVINISSSPTYAAPEYRQCLTVNKEGEVNLNPLKANKTTVDMPSYMSYQVGMALKEFVFESKLITLGKIDEEEASKKFIEWNSVSRLISNPSKEIQNISVLIEELTRPEPEKRLSVENFNSLIKNISLEPEKFLEKITEKSPASIQFHQSDKENVTLIDSILTKENIDNTDKEKLFAIPHLKSLLNRSSIKTGLDDYFNQINKQLFKEDVKKLGFFSWIRYKTGFNVTVPHATTLKELNSRNLLPVPDEKTKQLLEICATAGFQVHPQQEKLRQIGEKSNVDSKSSPVDENTNGVNNDASPASVRVDGTSTVVVDDGSVLVNGSVLVDGSVQADGSVLANDSVLADDNNASSSGKKPNFVQAALDHEDPAVLQTSQDKPVADIVNTIARGDNLRSSLDKIKKNIILEKFKNIINDTKNIKDLETLKEKMMDKKDKDYGEDYSMLQKARGVFTEKTGIDTSSVKKLKEMFREQEMNLKQKEKVTYDTLRKDIGF